MAKRYYCRVSTSEQKIDRQLVAFTEADVTYIDYMSGKTKNRPELQRMMADLKAGDIVVCKSIDRLSRSVRDLLDLVQQIHEKGANLQILDRHIDTNDDSGIGMFFFHIMGALAEFERKMIAERTKEGREIAKAQGKYKGRLPGSIAVKGESLARFKRFYALGMGKTELAKEFGVARSTIYRWIDELKRRGEIA